MIFTQCTVQRGGNTVYSGPTGQGVDVQIDAANLMVENFDAGAAPFDLFDIVVQYLDSSQFALQRDDYLVDVGLSNSGSYKVANRPEVFPTGRIQLLCMQKVGS